MLRKLFYALILSLLSLACYSQTTAYPASNINNPCNNEVFDLTVNTTAILGNQSFQNYSITYYTSAVSANAGTPAITNPTFYIINGTTQQIYARVTNLTTAEFAVTSFTITYNHVYAQPLPDINVCSQYTLPALQGGSYYTGPGGTGTMLTPGHVVTATTTLYTYAAAQTCVSENSFTITVGEPLVNQPAPIQYCGMSATSIYQVANQITQGEAGYTLTFHHSYEDAENEINPFTQLEMINYPLSNEPGYLYVRAEYTNGGCYTIVTVPVLSNDCTGNEAYGIVTYDIDNNGCNYEDVKALALPVHYTSGDTTITTFTNYNAVFYFQNMEDGNFEININPTGFVAEPATNSGSFPGEGCCNNFCLTAPTPFVNLEATLIPLTAAKPGFPVTYKLVVANHGSQLQNGAVTLNYDNALLSFVTASSAVSAQGNDLTFNYTGLQPFDNFTADVTFTVMLPEVAPAGTVLPFTLSAPAVGDTYTDDNTYILEDIVVNSFDPNEVIVHEGEFITEEQAAGYLTYTVHFQNEGTADAVYVRLETEIDPLLDPETLTMIESSHNYIASLDGNNLKFTFDRIALKPLSVNEASSKGFITYKIKPRPQANLGDSMAAAANIYFDFNEGIETNTAVTTITETAGIKDYTNRELIIYPNPASDTVTITVTDTTLQKSDIIVTDISGKIVISEGIRGGAATINIAALSSGVYFIKVTGDSKTFTQKLIKK